MEKFRQNKIRLRSDVSHLHNGRLLFIFDALIELSCVRVTARGAGSSFPAGFVEGRHAVVEFSLFVLVHQRFDGLIGGYTVHSVLTGHFGGGTRFVGEAEWG